MGIDRMNLIDDFSTGFGAKNDVIEYLTISRHSFVSLMMRVQIYVKKRRLSRGRVFFLLNCYAVQG
jgi:hypothetical protein